MYLAFNFNIESVLYIFNVRIENDNKKIRFLLLSKFFNENVFFFLIYKDKFTNSLQISTELEWNLPLSEILKPFSVLPTERYEIIHIFLSFWLVILVVVLSWFLQFFQNSKILKMERYLIFVCKICLFWTSVHKLSSFILKCILWVYSCIFYIYFCRALVINIANSRNL